MRAVQMAEHSESALESAKGQMLAARWGLVSL